MGATLENLTADWTPVERAALRAVIVLTAVVVVGSIVAAAWLVSGPRSSSSTDVSPRNPGGLAAFRDFEELTAAEVEASASGPYGAFHNDAWTEVTTTVDNGSNGKGNFRLICTVSHFAYDDPIISPGRPGASHLHMFWGNSTVDAFTASNVPPDPSDPHDLMSRGGSTCQGGPLNRSAYWMPAMLAGSAGPGRSVVVPKTITLYYKSDRPAEVKPLPPGIQLLVGNVEPGGAVKPSFTAAQHLGWGCYDPAQGRAVDLAPIIPGTNGTPQCPNGMDIQASIQFPQCIAVDGRGAPVLTSPDFVSHTLRLGSDSAAGSQSDQCPASHPYRVPQISYLVRWANPDGLVEAAWRLSSDQGADRSRVSHPGGSLHGDWLGGWNQNAIRAWIDGCFLADGGADPRNCSLGQTGRNGTSRKFKPIIGTNIEAQQYVGPSLIDEQLIAAASRG